MAHEPGKAWPEEHHMNGSLIPHEMPADRGIEPAADPTTLVPPDQAPEPAMALSHTADTRAATVEFRGNRTRSGEREQVVQYGDFPIALWNDKPARPFTWGILRDECRKHAFARRPHPWQLVDDPDHEAEVHHVQFLKAQTTPLDLSDYDAATEEILGVTLVECDAEEAELVRLRLLVWAEPMPQIPPEAIPHTERVHFGKTIPPAANPVGPPHPEHHATCLFQSTHNPFDCECGESRRAWQAARDEHARLTAERQGQAQEGIGKEADADGSR